MIIKEVIDMIDSLKPNTYTDAEKVLWLSKLDETIHNEIIMTHEHTEDEELFTAYDPNDDMERELIVCSPYDADLYMSYLESKIDYHNAETARYANSVLMFNSAYSTYANFYNRLRKPNPTKIRFL